jgi:integrase
MFGRSRPSQNGHDLTAFVDWLVTARNVAPATVRIYVRHARSYLADKPDDLSKWLVDVSPSPSGFTQRCSGLKAWGKYTRDKRLLGELEEIDRPKKPRGLPRPVPDWRERIRFASPEDRWAIIFLHETALRISEACAVDEKLPVGAELRVFGKGRKTRIIPLTTLAREALTALNGHMPYRPRTMQRHCRKLGFSPHRMRHTRATGMASAGCDIGDIQALLGHASPATTMIYSAWSTDRVRAALERAG